MGTYVNPGNEGFRFILRGEYVDKTPLLMVFSASLETPGMLVLVSRPRRFGKSYAAKMISAFFSAGCDSRQLSQNLRIADAPNWDARMNHYNAISLDMAAMMQASSDSTVVSEVSRVLLPELREIYAGAGARDAGYDIELKSALLDVVRLTGRKFVFVIDEWDALHRLAQKNEESQRVYADWLRALFKGNSFTSEAIAGAYLTGILPMKKYAHQSAVSDFREYTMVDPLSYAPYMGFTGEEVKALCTRHKLDLADVRRWYDGYMLRGADGFYDVYAPYSVMQACERGRTGSYWVSTEAYESLRPYIEMDFDGLQQDLVRAIGGASVAVDADGFQNDMTTILTKDDVLTLLVHLGYLAYDAQARTVRVPNDEVRGELARAVKRSRHPKLVAIMRESSQLLEDVLAGREDAVAAGFAHVHERDCSPLFYNNEQALRSVVRSALVALVDGYVRVEELPAGKGFAGMVYLPSSGSQKPALLVELKWNKPVDAAIEQIAERGYPEPLRGLDVSILAVGVTYDAKTKQHSCRIEVLDCE